MSTPARYGATQIYGCTVVIILDGRGVFIGHYPQIDSTGGITMDDEVSADMEIVEPLNKVLSDLEGTVELTTSAKVWVVHNVPRHIGPFNMLQYTRNRPGWQAIVKVLTEKFGVQEGNIRSQPYHSTAPETTNQIGKIVVDWVPMTDGANLHVYFNSETPVRYVYDADGNNCRLDPEDQPNGIAKI